MNARVVPSFLVAAAVLLTGCDQSAPRETLGRAAIDRYGCGACHRIPGVPRGVGLVGPSLEQIGTRNYIGGVLANNSENMVRWIQNPPAISPRTAMPNLHVTEADAREIAAYLGSLK